MKEHWQTIVRAIIKAACGGLVTKGYLDSSETETVMGAVVLLISVFWGIIEKKKIANGNKNTVTTNIAKTTETK